MGKPPRDRTARRQRERAAQGLVRDREKLDALAPGGSATRPLAVDTVAVIELRATRTPCPQCQGELQLLAHDAVVVDERRLRVVRMRCRTCGAPRERWFVVETPLPN
jgi:hypothetical protein